MKFSTAAVLAFASLAAVAQAATLDDIKKRGSIRLGYSETSVPFSYKNKAGEPAGYSIELCKSVVEGEGVAANVADMKTE